jgi:DNA polymerase-3 subunit delta
VPAARDSRDVLSAIEKGELAPVYCLIGEERFLVDRCLEGLRRAVLGADAAGDASFNFDHFELKERSLAQVLDSARTLPMFARRRLIFARGIDELKSDELEPLFAYLEDPNPSTCLVLVGGTKVDGRLKIFQALKKHGYLHDFPHLRDWQLGDWLQAEAGRRKLSLAAEAARLLAESAGPDLGRMAMCLEQAALYAGAEGRITADHVQAVVPESRERGIFELTKAIGAGQRAQALRLLGNLLRNREPALRIQFMLMRQLRQIWRAKELQAAGAPRNEIAGRVGISPHFLDDVLQPARRMSTGALARSFDLLYQADQSLKSSRVDPDIQITRLVTALVDQVVSPPVTATTTR